jgi:hypothetical protein
VPWPCDNSGVSDFDWLGPKKDTGSGGTPRGRAVEFGSRVPAVPRDEVLANFATAPAIDVGELRSDLDAVVAQDIRDPYEGTGR